MSQYRIRIVQDQYPGHPLEYTDMPCEAVNYERNSDFAPRARRGICERLDQDVDVPYWIMQKRLQGYSVAQGDGFFLIADAKKLGDWSGNRKANKRNLDAMVKEVEAWARGEVYGYIIDKLVPECTTCGRAEHWNEIDSCYGFYDSKYAIEAAREACPQSDVEVVWE